MTAKEIFRGIARTEALLKTKKHRAAMLKSIAISPQSTNCNGMPSNPSPSHSKVADTICKALDLEEEIKQEESALREKKLCLLELVGAIDCADCQSVLIMRYFEHLSWREIANKMYYSERWVYKLHGHALAEMDKILPQDNENPANHKKSSVEFS